MARFWRGPLFFVTAGLFCLSVSCKHQRPINQVEAGPAEKPGVRLTSLACLGAAHDRDIDKLISFFAEEASVLPSSGPVVHGKDQVRQFWSPLLANPSYNLSWRYTGLEVGKLGDMAYETGTYEMTLADPKGRLMTSRGKFLIVWKKLPSGQWKIAAYMSSAE